MINFIKVADFSSTFLSVVQNVRRGLSNNRLSNRRLCLAASQAVNYFALNQYKCIVLYYIILHCILFDVIIA